MGRGLDWAALLRGNLFGWASRVASGVYSTQLLASGVPVSRHWLLALFCLQLTDLPIGLLVVMLSSTSLVPGISTALGPSRHCDLSIQTGTSCHLLTPIS